MEPANNAAVSTWRTLKVLKDSCFRSLRLLWSRVVNWLNQVDKLLLPQLLLLHSFEGRLVMIGVSFSAMVVMSMQAAFTLGANNEL